MSEATIGDMSKRRSYFESDVVFVGEMVSVLTKAYEEASIKAARSAWVAIAHGGLKSTREAQWDEAVAQTIQAVLCCAPHTRDTPEFRAEDAIELPERPDF